MGFFDSAPGQAKQLKVLFLYNREPRWAVLGDEVCFCLIKQFPTVTKYGSYSALTALHAVLEGVVTLLPCTTAHFARLQLPTSTLGVEVVKACLHPEHFVVPGDST